MDYVITGMISRISCQIGMKGLSTSPKINVYTFRKHWDVGLPILITKVDRPLYKAYLSYSLKSDTVDNPGAGKWGIISVEILLDMRCQNYRRCVHVVMIAREYP